MRGSGWILKLLGKHTPLDLLVGEQWGFDLSSGVDKPDWGHSSLSAAESQPLHLPSPHHS